MLLYYKINKKWERLYGMKKVITIFLTIFMLCLSLCSCGKSKAVKNVEDLIGSIGVVSADSEAAVAAAEKAYSELTEKEKETVENATVLTEAKKTLEIALQEKRLEELYDAISGEWVNVYDMDHYLFNRDGSGTHEGKEIEYTVDPEAQTMSITEGVSAVTQNFKMDLEKKTPRLIPENAAVYYVEAQNYDTVAQEIRQEYTEILTSYEYWSNTQGLNYIMFGESGGGFFLLSGTTLGMEWEWLDNNTFKASFEYSGTRYSNILTIIETNEGPRLINDQNIIMFTPKNKIK